MTVKDKTDLQLKLPSKFQLISYDIILPYEWSLAPKASFTTLLYISLNFFSIISSYGIFFYIFVNKCHLKPTERTIFFADSKMDVLKTNITVFLILFPVIIKAQQNIQGNNY